MTVWPLRFRPVDNGPLFFADDAGAFFASDDAFLQRYAEDALTLRDDQFLSSNGHSFEDESDPSYIAFAYRWAARQHTATPAPSYIILVPTLRCNLACNYCQVSRAAISANGYDWTDQTLGEVLRFLDDLPTSRIKIEFQGGEPLLRPDLIRTVSNHCRQRFDQSEFVVCTNLQILDDERLELLTASDTFVSTSIDGPLADHDRNRTHDPRLADEFLANVARVNEKVVAGHLSALPTIDVSNPPDLDALIDTYERLGLRSIYLRPVNYQGFARRAAQRADEAVRWNALHGAFIDRLVERNFETGTITEEFYFSHCLKRFLRAGHDGHVDLRNPSLFGSDYLVIDYDGTLYPSDEARMLARVGQINLAIGTAKSGVDRVAVEGMNGSAFNNFDADCIHCPYQPFCRTDPIDSVSRYGRVDMPKADTWFCQRHTAIFDRIVRMIYGGDAREHFSLAAWAGVASWPSELAPRHDSAPA